MHFPLKISAIRSYDEYMNIARGNMTNKIRPSKRIKKLWRTAPDGRSLKQYAREVSQGLTPASDWAKAWLKGKK